MTNKSEPVVQEIPPKHSNFFDQIYANNQLQRPVIALLIFRVAFFTLLFYDLWFISLGHAPRYGVSEFNVAHIPFLDQLFMPTITIQGAFYIIAGLLSLLLAFGWGNRVAMISVALIYNIAYFDSQADSYQHHYLLSLLLLLMAWFPWHQIKDLGKTFDLSLKSHWVLDALCIELGLVYFWTALTKSEATWLSGVPLKMMVSSTSAVAHINQISMALNIEVDQLFQFAAWSVMIGEFMAPLLLWVRKLRPIGFLIIPWFHIMVEWIGFDIELFSYYMLLLNLILLAPQWFWHILIKGLQLCTSVFDKFYRFYQIQWATPLYGSLPLILGLSLSTFVALLQLPIEGNLIIAVLSGLMMIFALDHHLPKRTLLPILIVILGAVWSLNQSEIIYDYYRMWGGDLQRRGELEKSITVYQKANDIKKIGLARHFNQAQLLVKINEPQKASLLYIQAVERHLQERKLLNQKQREVGIKQDVLDAIILNETQLAERAEILSRHLKQYPVAQSELQSDEQRNINQNALEIAKIAYQNAQKQEGINLQYNFFPKREVKQILQTLSPILK